MVTFGKIIKNAGRCGAPQDALPAKPKTEAKRYYTSKRRVISVAHGDPTRCGAVSKNRNWNNPGVFVGVGWSQIAFQC